VFHNLIAGLITEADEFLRTISKENGRGGYWLTAGNEDSAGGAIDNFTADVA